MVTEGAFKTGIIVFVGAAISVAAGVAYAKGWLREDEVKIGIISVAAVYTVTAGVTYY